MPLLQALLHNGKMIIAPILLPDPLLYPDHLDQPKWHNH
jgi:hypothetical protein